MATSGTVSTTVWDNRLVIDHAYRACRISPQRVTGEMIQTGLEQLYLIVSSWANKGAPLWCYTRYLLPMYMNQFTVPCPRGTVDVLESNIRDISGFSGTKLASEGTADNAFDSDIDTACTQTTPAGWVELDLDTAMTLTTVGLMPYVTGTWDVSFQYSDDGISWTSFLDIPAFSAEFQKWYWADVEGMVNHQYYRLKANGTTVLNVAELWFANNPSAIPLARVNIDDYYNLPNRTFPGRPVQYYMDRQRDVCNMKIWPVPDSASQFRQLEVVTHRYIMDVGNMQQELEVPQRWWDAVVWVLGARLAKITPEVKVDMIPVVQMEADKLEKQAWAEERDDSPIFLQPNFSVYTR